MNFIFKENLYFLLLFWAVGSALTYWLYKRSKTIIPYYFDTQKIRFYSPELKAFLRGIALAFIGFSLLGPYLEHENQYVPILNKEIIFLLDVSASMNCEDVPPSRLKKAKKEIEKMVEKLQGNRMGLIVFTSFPYVQSPLTNDSKALKMFLDLIETNQFANTGTDFRRALLKASERFTPDSLAQGASKTIVLISDGEDFGGKHASVIEYLKDQNIKVYCVGVGTKTGAYVPKPEGGLFYNPNGSPAVSKLHDQYLKQIAQKFKTPYYELQNVNSDLSKLTEDLEKEQFMILGKEEQIKESNFYQGLVLVGFIALLWSMLWIPQQKQI